VLTRVRAQEEESTTGAFLPFDRDTLFELLCAERTPDILAAELTDAAEESGFADLTMALARALDGRMRTEPIDLAKAGAILLAGPMGSGKTSVAAKLASEARVVGRPVRLVATDLTGAGAIARLNALADPIGVTVTMAANGEELADSLAAAAAEKSLIIADTAGFDPRPRSAWREFLFLTRGSGEIVGVISALTDAQEAAEMAQALHAFGASRLIVTGLDSARRRGTVVALAAAGLAIAQVSYSPFVANGLAPLTPLGLARDIASRAAPFIPLHTVRAA
jgi:flagellar biosynthesis protein FlhF